MITNESKSLPVSSVCSQCEREYPVFNRETWPSCPFCGGKMVVQENRKKEVITK